MRIFVLAVSAPLLMLFFVSVSIARNCVIADPNDTTLNVRDSPNGKVVNRLRNGRIVNIGSVKNDPKGRPWGYASGQYKGKNRNWGWVFMQSVDCGGGSDRSGSNSSSENCVIADPTDTSLNVRDLPNGRVVNRLRNGRNVSVLRTENDSKGRPWGYAVGNYKGQKRNWGWVFMDAVKCAGTAGVAMDGACLVNDTQTKQRYQVRWSGENKWHTINVEPGKRWCHSRPAGTKRLVLKRDGRQQQVRLKQANCVSMNSCPGAGDFAQLSMRQLLSSPAQANSNKKPTQKEALAYCRKFIGDSLRCMTRTCGPVARSFSPARKYCEVEIVDGYPKSVCRPNRNYDSDLAKHRAWNSCAAAKSKGCQWNITEKFKQGARINHSQCAAWYIENAASSETNSRPLADGASDR